MSMFNVDGRSVWWLFWGLHLFGFYFDKIVMYLSGGSWPIGVFYVV